MTIMKQNNSQLNVTRNYYGLSINKTAYTLSNLSYNRKNGQRYEEKKIFWPWSAFSDMKIIFLNYYSNTRVALNSSNLNREVKVHEAMLKEVELLRVSSGSQPS